MFLKYHNNHSILYDCRVHDYCVDMMERIWLDASYLFDKKRKVADKNRAK